jgi:PAS domain-containing protein
LERGIEWLGSQRAGIEWAAWIVTRRSAIERALALRLGDATPSPASAESEALRRFRSWAAASLRRGAADTAPALDGLRLENEHAERVLQGWCAAAVEVAGSRGGELQGLLAPLEERFRAALLGTHVARQIRSSPRIARRAVVGAIDRIADAYLAVEVEEERVVDANPAAATLLRTTREKLIGASTSRLLHADTRLSWRDELAELLESDEPRRFRAIWVDALGRPIAVEAHATRHVVGRERVMALVVARVL